MQIVLAFSAFLCSDSLSQSISQSEWYLSDGVRRLKSWQQGTDKCQERGTQQELGQQTFNDSPALASGQPLACCVTGSKAKCLYW